MTNSDYLAEVEAWQQEMDAQMRLPGPGGWLAIVGMYPLKQGVNTIGSAAGSDVFYQQVQHQSSLVRSIFKALEAHSP